MDIESSLPIIGRAVERAQLQQINHSPKPEFVAVYGRRRVGKTHLIRGTFQNHADLYFQVTGQQKGNQTAQLLNFKESIEAAFQIEEPLPQFKNWRNAFEVLVQKLETFIRQKNPQSVVIFFDELPWLSTKRSNLVSMLDYFWNTRFAHWKCVRLVVCGSAASWMIRQILDDTGGLHNRVTHVLRLEPLSLAETQKFLNEGGTRSGKMQFNPKQTLELFMTLGGVPAYLMQVQAQLSAAQNVGRLYFGKDAPLRPEFDRLFKSLFEHSEAHRKIVRSLAGKRSGLSREELSIATGIKTGGVFSLYLKELEEAGFVEGFVPYLKKKKDRFYRLIDEFSWFYLHWVEDAPQGAFTGSGIDYWLTQFKKPRFQAWGGYCFESICLKHVQSILKALHASSVIAQIGPWKYVPQKKMKNLERAGTQIDLVIDREDGVINLLEMKYSSEPYVVDAQLAREMIRKTEIFVEQTHTKKQIMPVLVTPFGASDSPWIREVFQGGVLTLEHLFRDA